MAIRSTFNQTSALRELRAIQEIEYMEILEDMKEEAMLFLKDAREQLEGHDLGFYNNRSFELRESIAAYIFKDGKLVWYDENGNAEENRRLIMEGNHIVSKGFTFVGIAGKNYASHVESKGYNVLTNQGEAVLFNLEVTYKKRHGKL